MPATAVSFLDDLQRAISFRDIARPTDMRTMIASAVSLVGLGNTVPSILPEKVPDCRANAILLSANRCATVFDNVVHQNVHGTNPTWYVLEPFPVVPPHRFKDATFGPKTAAEIARDPVLELTYTAHDMAPFAKHMGDVDESSDTLLPFRPDTSASPG